MLITLLTALLLFIYACLIFFYYFQWKKVPLNNHATPLPAKASVTVLIAARNEEHNLPLLLEDLTSQDYPPSSYEVIVIDDHSTDSTANVIKSFPNRNFHMISPACRPEESTKKKAIATGVDLAKGDLIIITDADCRVGAKWISTIASLYEQTGSFFIAAPVKYEHDRSLLEVLQSLDFMTLQGITAASVGSGFSSMTNGANLAYTKKAFLQVNGFEGIDKVATGDDMLLMHKIWQLDKSKVTYLKSRDAIVHTQPMHTWKDFFMQRRRWASKTFIYDDFKIIAVLVVVYFVNLLFFVLVIAAILNNKYWLLTLIYLIAKTVIELPFISSIARFYQEERLLKYFFLLQPVHIAYTVVVGFASQFGKYEWKGRRTR